MKCSKCGTEYDGERCPLCGAKAAGGTRCPACGEENAAGAKFCARCGKELAGGIRAAESAPPQAAVGDATAQTELTDDAAAAQTAQTEQMDEVTAIFAKERQKWEFGQPREKSANALLLQWGCFLFSLLFAASGIVFFFVDVFSYSLGGFALESVSPCAFSGLFRGGVMGVSELSVFYGYGHITVMTVLYAVMALFAVLELCMAFVSLGDYSFEKRFNSFVDSVVQTVLSAAAMVAYIIFSSSFFGDMGIAVGELGILPYVCFCINVVLCIFAALFRRAKNEDGLAYLRVWDVLGVRKKQDKSRVVFETVSALLLAAALVILFLCYPLFTDGAAQYTLTELFAADHVWKVENTVGLASADSEEEAGFARAAFIVAFLIMAVCFLLVVLFSVLYAKGRGAKPNKAGGTEVLMLAFFVLAVWVGYAVGVDSSISFAIWDLPVIGACLLGAKTVLSKILSADSGAKGKASGKRRLLGR